MVFNADLKSGSGHLTVWASDDIDGNADIATVDGTVYLLADNNDDSEGKPDDGVNLADGTQLDSGNGNVRIEATNESDIYLNDIQAGAGAVSLLAERDILDNNGATINVTAATLRAVADSDSDEAGWIGGTATTNGDVLANVNAIDTEVATLAAKSADGIYIEEESAVTVDLTGDLSIEQVNFNSTTTTRTDASLSDLETTDAGDIKVVALAGAITINEGDADDTGVIAATSGAILLEARGAGSDVVFNADFESGSGHLTVWAANDIQVNADIATTDGTIYLAADAGELALADGTRITSTSGDIRLVAQNDLKVSGVTTAGDVALTAVMGSILDQGDADGVDIIAGGLRLAAGVGVGMLGMLADALEISVDTVSARANGGGINLVETDGLAVDDVAVTIERVNFNSTTTTAGDAAQSDLRTEGGSGAIVVVVQSGDLTLNDGSAPLDSTAVSTDGSGNILLQTLADSGSIHVNGHIRSGTGNVSVVAGASLDLADGVDITTAGGFVDLEAGVGSFAMAAGGGIDSGGGNIRIFAGENVVLGVVDAQGGDVRVIAERGSILEATDATATVTHVLGGNVSLTAGNAIGGFSVREYRIEFSSDLRTWTPVGSVVSAEDAVAFEAPAPGTGMAFYRMRLADANATAQFVVPTLLPNGNVQLTLNREFVGPFAGTNALEIDAANLSAEAGAGGVNVVDVDGLNVAGAAVSIQRVNVMGGSTTIDDTALSGVMTTDSGSVVVRTQAGDLELLENVAVMGGGHIRLEAMADTGILNLAAAAQTGTGHVSLVGGSTVTLAGDITTGGDGTVSVESRLGGVSQTDGTTVSNATGDVRVLAEGDITVASIATQADVALTSRSGSLLDAGDMDTDVQGAGLRIEVAVGVGVLGAGVDDALETDVDTVSASAGAGGINLLEIDGLTIGDTSATVQVVGLDGTLQSVSTSAQSDLVTTGGAIVARATAGDVEISDGTGLPNGVGVVSAGGNVRIEAIGAAGSTTVNAAVNAGGGHLTILAGDGVTLASDATTSGTGTVDVQAFNGPVTMSDGVAIVTEGGNVRVAGGGDVMVGVIDARTAADRMADGTAMQDQWGQVSVIAGGSVLDAPAAAIDGIDIHAENARLVSGGSVGQQPAGTGNALETELVTVAVAAGTDGMHIVDASSLAVGTVAAVDVERVLPDGTTDPNTDTGGLRGATKTGGVSTIRTAIGEPVTDFPTFAITDILDASSRPNVLTGLYEQRVVISNTNGSTIDAVRVIIRGLPAGVTVFNAVGEIDGLPYIQYNLPLADGESVSLLIEYVSPGPSVIPITTDFLPEVVGTLPDPDPAGEILKKLTVSRLNDGRLALAFDSLVGRTYYVQFSENDGQSWDTVLSPIDGTGRRIVWVDNGAPKTPTDTVGLNRTYRVILADVVNP